jgi:glycogen debranching enzyme
VSNAVRIRPRPFTTHISRGRAVLATTLQGLLDGGADHGLFVDETRLLSRWKYWIDDAEPLPNALSVLDQHRWMGYFVIAAPGGTLPEPDDGSGQVPASSQRTLELQVRRSMDDGGMREELTLTNYTTETSSFAFAIELEADFADLVETRKRVQHGTTGTSWDGQRLAFHYRATHGSETLDRECVVTLDRAAHYEEGRLTFQVTLQPKEIWRCTLHCGDGTERASDDPFSDDRSPDALLALDQAEKDLDALRLGETVAAGLPLYIAVYGRDTLTAGWQAAIRGPELMTGALRTLAELQGTREDDWRDEQPGKMLHEAHTGPLAMLRYNPRRRSYSSITTSGLYAFIVAELWHWTGDKDLVRPFIEPALRALQWLERYGDLDGDGFYEYQSRSPMGPRNQAWKDSPDAIVYEDGTLVDPPIATCEEQAFVYIARLHLAETLFFLGERDLSRKLHRQAVELKKRFHDAFWMEEEGFYALALDAQKRQVRSIASNAGHCVAAAITEASLVEKTVDRLFAEDMFSGWGIRTLSSDHPSYNPYSYHLGSIWPVEQGTFALGFMRYGLHDRVSQLARAHFEAASLFELHRLPELFGGHPRDEQHPFPGIYPNANSPQAWSASSVFAMVQAILGLYPYAPLKLLVIDPHLPDWLPEYTLRDLQVGKAVVTIHFRRRKDGRSTYRILEQQGKLHVVRQATPWSLTAQPAERLRDALASLVK